MMRCFPLRRRRVARGQALVLFALSVSALIGLVGLSVDGLRVYIAFGEGQRAAEAAALAGVAYLPQYLSNITPAPDGNDATTRALAAAAQNGFPNAADVTIAVVPGSTVPTLRVTIRVMVPLSLVAVVNPAPSVTMPTATAALLPPITLGDGAASFGDMPEGMSAQLAAIAGSDEVKERGDPFTPSCETGWSDGADALHTDATTPLYFTGLLHVATNAPQYLTGPNCSPGAPGNPDAIPAGFAGLATSDTPVPTGSNYLITLPPGGANYSVWVWNPRFAYSGSGNDSQFFTNENVFTPFFRDNPQFYPRIAYSLFSVPQVYDRTRDVPIAALWPSATPPDTSPNPPLVGGQLVTLPSVDTSFFDLLLHGCPLTGAWNLTGGSSYQLPIAGGQGCLASVPADYHHWVRVGAQTLAATASGPAYFRLAVDTATGVGLHGYAIKVCQNALVAPGCGSGGATVAPWNAATVQLAGTAHQLYPLMTVPAAFAGRQITVGLYNPGTGSGTVTVRLVPPVSGGTVAYPAWARMTTVAGMPAIQTSLLGDDRYHGKWVRLTVTLPADYAGGQWQLAWDSTAAPAATALMTVTATLIGKPMQLLAG